jgi:hypothetical protein
MTVRTVVISDIMTPEKTVTAQNTVTILGEIV